MKKKKKKKKKERKSVVQTKSTHNVELSVCFAFNLHLSLRLPQLPQSFYSVTATKT